MLEQITIKAVHYDLSDTSKKFIEEKLSKLDYLKKFITDGTIRIIRDSEQYKAEADIYLHHKQRIHIDTISDQLYPAIENLVHKLKHKLSEEHKKIKSHHNSHSPSMHHGDGHPPITEE